MNPRKAEITRNWWASLSPEQRQAFLEQRRQACLASPHRSGVGGKRRVYSAKAVA